MPKRKAASHDVAQSTPSSVSLSVRWALSGEILSVVCISPEARIGGACDSWEEKAWHIMRKNAKKIDYVPHPSNKDPGQNTRVVLPIFFGGSQFQWAMFNQASAEELISSLPLDAHESQHLQAVVWACLTTVRTIRTALKSPIEMICFWFNKKP